MRRREGRRGWGGWGGWGGLGRWGGWGGWWESIGRRIGTILHFIAMDTVSFIRPYPRSLFQTRRETSITIINGGDS